MISLLVKTINRCNARCLYCNSIARDEKGMDIGFPVLERVFGRIEEHLHRTGECTLEILWRGGAVADAADAGARARLRPSASRAFHSGVGGVGKRSDSLRYQKQSMWCVPVGGPVPCNRR
jgi:hypothetical protein